MNNYLPSTFVFYRFRYPSLQKIARTEEGGEVLKFET